jgi:hypothetical protein
MEGITKDVALKIIPKKKVKGNEASVWDEMEMLKGLDHPNIVCPLFGWESNGEFNVKCLGQVLRVVRVSIEVLSVFRACGWRRIVRTDCAEREVHGGGCCDSITVRSSLSQLPISQCHT